MNPSLKPESRNVPATGFAELDFTDSAHPAMIALAQALRAERVALESQDVDGLMRATEAKLVAVHQLERNPPIAAAKELTRLAELNRANGALLARRRRLVQWSLRALGRTGSASDYNSSGVARIMPYRRALAVY
jgi:flagellar biosynthesis/type III secretory pathway chaperone